MKRSEIRKLKRNLHSLIGPEQISMTDKGTNQFFASENYTIQTPGRTYSARIFYILTEDKSNPGYPRGIVLAFRPKFKSRDDIPHQTEIVLTYIQEVRTFENTQANLLPYSHTNRSNQEGSIKKSLRKPKELEQEVTLALEIIQGIANSKKTKTKP